MSKLDDLKKIIRDSGQIYDEELISDIAKWKLYLKKRKNLHKTIQGFIKKEYKNR